MTPSEFPEANQVFGPPQGMDETQVQKIPAFVGQIVGEHNLDGSDVVVVAWKPSSEDIVELMTGGLVFLTCHGGLPPHSLATKFPFTLKS